MPPMLGASLADILNSSARSDEESQKRTVRIFGSVLGLLLFLDVAGSLATLYLVCRMGDCNEERTASDHHHPNSSRGGDGCISKCLLNSIRRGIHLHPIFKVAEPDDGSGDDDDDHHHQDNCGEFGDLFILSLVRSAATLLLLYIGIRCGRHSKAPTADSPPSQQQQGASCIVVPSQGSDAAINELEEPLLLADSDDRDSQERDEADAEDATNNWCQRTVSFCTNPVQIKNAIFLVLFVASTFFQVYAGLRVSTSCVLHRDQHSSAFTYMVIILLMCLTVLCGKQKSVKQNLLGSSPNFRDELPVIPEFQDSFQICVSTQI